ncbi:MAG TPA: NADH-quinone oxidoreductase subunit L [Geobacteraceae bacterium]
MKLYLSLILLLPLLGSVTNAIFGRRLPRRAVEFIGCGVVWGAFVSALLAFLDYRGPLRVELFSWLTAFDLSAPVTLYLDPLSMVMVLMITFVCGLIHVYSVAYMADDEGYVRFFFLLNLFVFAMLVLVLAENLPLLYLGWEGVGFCSYALIGFWYREEKNATAGRKAFIVTRVGDVAFGIAVVWMFRLFDSLSIVEINRMGLLAPAGIVTALGLLLLIGAMGKSAQVPLMVWLPDAMAGPTPVSALIHAATMVTAGVYLLARMYPLIGASSAAMAAIALTGGVTAFYAATCALAQRDLKRALAYSTISQIGYMILGVGAGAIAAATFHLLVHAFFKALLFLGAGCVIAAMHHEQDIFKMGGLARRLPLTYWPFLAGAACLAGLPLTGGFFSKDSILAAVGQKGGALYGGLFILGLLTALLTSIYTFRLVYLVFGGPSSIPPPLMYPKGHKGGGEGEGEKAGITPTPPLPHQGGGSIKVPRLMEAMLAPLALLGLCGGLINLPAYLGGGWLDRFLDPLAVKGAVEASPTLELLLQAVAGALALAGLAAVHYYYGGKRRQERLVSSAGPMPGPVAFLLNGWRFDDLYRVLFIRPYEVLARILWERVDEGVIDDSLDRLASILGRAGEGLGAWTTGRVSVYLLSLAAGLALVLAYLAWLFL